MTTNTRLLYFEDQSLTNAQANVVQVVRVDNLFGAILDHTVFHVQGGGQPGDCGLINCPTATFPVIKTIRDPTIGQALHIDSFKNDSMFEVGSQAELRIDEEYRRENSRPHSAGQLIDLAVQRLGLDWTPANSSHLPDVCYVEYNGTANYNDDLK